ncbi:MAG: ribonuclease III [Proteobacteria bacterium]|nr:ribonuclease III [Pseudomonadota bacterium]
MMEHLSKLEQKIGIKFKDKTLLEKSLIHKSNNSAVNNEKLEFLGDRVLGLVLANTLLKIYPNDNEGTIDKKFANLVNKRTCLHVAKKIELKKYITTGDSHKSPNKSSDKIFSDGLEALLGAIFLDQGLQITEKFILNIWSEFLEKSIETEIDSKTQLQEYSLKKFKLLPVYIIKKQSGPQHRPVFKVEVQIKNSKKFYASGTSKKNAQQNAAQKLLADLKTQS